MLNSKFLETPEVFYSSHQFPLLSAPRGLLETTKVIDFSFFNLDENTYPSKKLSLITSLDLGLPSE